MKMTTAQVVETSVTVSNNSPIQDYILHSPGWLYSTYLWNDSWVQTFHRATYLFVNKRNYDFLCRWLVVVSSFSLVAFLILHRIFWRTYQRCITITILGILRLKGLWWYTAGRDCCMLSFYGQALSFCATLYVSADVMLSTNCLCSGSFGIK